MIGGEIDSELGNVHLEGGLAAGQEKLDQILVLHLASKVNEGLGALGTLQGGEVVVVLHALQPFPHIPAGDELSQVASAAGEPQ